MMSGTHESVTIGSVDWILVLNSQDRSMRVLKEIVKHPIFSPSAKAPIGRPPLCSLRGRPMNAFHLLDQSHITALVVNAKNEDAAIMSLAKHIARRGHRPLVILADIELLLRGTPQSTTSSPAQGFPRNMYTTQLSCRRRVKSDQSKQFKAVSSH